MTRTRTEIAADLRAMGPAAIRRLDGLVCEAIAELLDPHVERPEPLLLGYRRSQWEAFDMSPDERATVEAAFTSTGCAEGHLEQLVDIL